MERLKASHWVIVVATEHVRLAAPLRHTRGVEVLSCDGVVWLRGPLWRGLAQDELEQRLLRLIPGVRPYWLGEDGQLTKLGDLVPSARLPAGPWILLADWLQIELPTLSSFFPGDIPTVALSLKRSGDECEATLVLTSFAVWSEYADAAPQWRLDRLVFAMNASQQVFIRGTPLPPLPGQRWVERNGVATPAGWTWTPEISPVVLRNKFGLHPGDLALIDGEARWEGEAPAEPRVGNELSVHGSAGASPSRTSRWQVIRETDWVRATRSAVRMTAEAVHGT